MEYDESNKIAKAILEIEQKVKVANAAGLTPKAEHVATLGLYRMILGIAKSLQSML